MQDFKIIPLTRSLAKQYAGDICQSLDQIPNVDPHTPDQLLQEKKGDRVLYKKWDHSFILLRLGKFVGVIIGYERKSESNDQYPHNSIYLNHLAIAKEFQRQGLGRYLIQEWLTRNKKIGFLELKGKLRFSVQTNKETWNQHVQSLYESFGFKKVSEKVYGNRTDNVYLLNPSP